MSETTTTGKAYRVLVDALQDVWTKVSFWTAASDVEMSNGQTLPTFLESKANKDNPELTGKMSMNTNISQVGTYGVALCKNNSAYGRAATSVGENNSAGGDQSFAGGLNSSNSGDVSLVYGEGLNSSEDYATILGKYNDTSIANVLLAVGYGADNTHRKNVFTLDKTGNLNIEGNIEAANITSNGDITITGDFTNGDGETLSGKLDLSDLEDAVTFNAAGGMTDSVTIGTLEVGETQYNILSPTPDFSIVSSSAPGYIKNKPTKLSDFSNDSGFITNTVNNLTNYYLKTETYTKAEVNALISGASSLNILVVQTLPTQDISTTTIYLVPKQGTGTNDIYNEYIYVNNAWELIGTTEIDLSNYYTKTEADALLSAKISDNPTFTEASTRTNIASGESFATILGKIKKYFTDFPSGTYYGTCVNQAANQNKVVTISADQHFSLTTGTIIFVKFDANNTYSATAENPVKLNVNNTGNINIYAGSSSTPTGTNTTFFGRTNHVNQYIYDGSYWVWSGSSADNNNTYTPQGLGIGYGTCGTAASTTAKTATLSGYGLVTNGTVAIKFTNAVPANATLNINSKGAKAIYYRGSAITSGIINAGDTATFFYNGSQYHLVSIDNVKQQIQSAIDAIFSTGQAGQFLVSDGNGGYNWVTIPVAEGNSF